MYNRCSKGGIYDMSKKLAKETIHAKGIEISIKGGVPITDASVLVPNVKPLGWFCTVFQRFIRMRIKRTYRYGGIGNYFFSL